MYSIIYKTGIYKRPIANIMIKEWIFPQGGKNIYIYVRQGYPLSPFVFNLTDGFSQCIKATWEVKNIYNGKEEVKLFLITDDMIICYERIYKTPIRTHNCI